MLTAKHFHISQYRQRTQRESFTIPLDKLRHDPGTPRLVGADPLPSPTALTGRLTAGGKEAVWCGTGAPTILLLTNYSTIPVLTDHNSTTKLFLDSNFLPCLCYQTGVLESWRFLIQIKKWPCATHRQRYAQPKVTMGQVTVPKRDDFLEKYLAFQIIK